VIVTEGGPHLTEHKPLRGRSVIITRQRSQATEMAVVLEEAGARLIYCPTIEIVPPDSWSDLDDAIKRISGYDWIVFTSANGVRFFDQRLHDLGLDIAIISSLVACAIGPATAAALVSAGARVDVTAADSRAEGAIEAIINRIGGVAGVKGLRFLIPRAEVARELLPSELRRQGAVVDPVDAYKTIKPDLDSLVITRLLEQGQVDAITFTSPSTVEHFADLLGRQDLPALLSGVLIACIGPVTAAAARQHRLEHIIEPDFHNGEALARIIIEAFAQKGDKEPQSK
jgi:uroporphyrinogen III methyltransferase/synthase